MISGAQIVEEARTWLGTPFHHQGRLKNVGVDCIGLVIGVLHALKLSDFDIKSYPRIPNGSKMYEVMCEEMQLINTAQRLPGDIGLFTFDRHPQHVAIFTDIGIIHSYSEVKKCVEHSFNAPWDKRLVAVFRARGLG